MKKFTILLLLFSFTAKAQLQLIISGGNPTELVAAGGGTYTQGITLTANTTLKTLDNKAYTISGIITGAFNLTTELAANSKLTLSGANTYSGSTSITGGELILTNTPDFGSTNLSVSAGATLTIDASTIDASTYDNANLALPYPVFGSYFTSNITVTGAGQVNFKGVKDKYYGVYSSTKSMVFNMGSGGQLNITGGTWTIGASGVQAFTGNLGSLNVAADTKFTISGTTAQFDKVTGTGRIQKTYDAVNDLTIKIGAANGTCNWDGVFYDGGLHKINIEKVGTGTIAFTNTNLQSGTITITEGALSIGNGGDSGYIGEGNIVNNATLILNKSQDLSLLNSISGTGNLVKKGGRSADLFGDQVTRIVSYTGTTTVESGELTLKCKEIKSSAITVQNGATLATYPDHTIYPTNNGVITSIGGLSMTANSVMHFVFTIVDNPYAKLVVPTISASDGFLMKFTGNALASLSGDKVLIGCTGTLPTKLPTIVESSVSSGLDSKKCIALKWVQGTGLVGTITSSSSAISPAYLNTCVGGTQRFTVTSGGNPATPAWTSSNPEVVSITAGGVAKLLLPGASTITYSNTDGCTVSTFITARGHALRLEYPNAAFCVGERITLKAYNSSTGGATSTFNPAWTSDNERVATVNTGDKGPGEPVGYVTLLARGTTTINFSTGDMCDARYEITVKDSPTISPSTPVVCVGSTITLTGSGTAATTNPWTSAATSIIATITSTGVASGVSNGNATIIFTSNNGCTATTLLSVKAAPVANAGGDKQICAGSSVAIGVPAQTGVSGVTYSWAPATGLSASNMANPTANPTATTTYTLTASIGGSQCLGTDQVEVKVNPLPTLTSAQGVSSFIKPTATIELTAFTDGSTNPWATSDATKVTIAAGTDAKKATATGVALGNANITYTDVKGCIGTHSVTVSNKTNQTITFAPISDKTVGDADFTLSATASSGLTVTFSATSDKVTITGSSVKIKKAGKASIQANQAGNDTYTPAPQISSNTFCINPAMPTITYTESNKTLTSSSPDGNQWFLNGTAIPGATANTYIVPTDGSYTVKVTIEECVSALSAAKAIVVTGDIPDHEFHIYPNPVHDELVIQLPSREDGSITLSTITGQVLHSSQANGKTILSMRDFPAGIYILKIQTARITVVKKVGIN